MYFCCTYSKYGSHSQHKSTMVLASLYYSTASGVFPFIHLLMIPLIHPSIHLSFCSTDEPLNIFNIKSKILKFLEMHFILEVLHVFLKINELGFSKLSVRFEIEFNQRLLWEKKRQK